LLLRKLEIYGFKSFADRVYMKFDKGITAIVGPNGSGKSNVADAVRWVLGEQSAKSLRGSRMEDIIFSGTQVRKSLGFAEVSLTLDNSDATLPVDFSEVTITRRVFRSGESEYMINRSACRLKDIVELFMDTGVGKEGYSIIGQGRIDEILSHRSEDRRYIFEEAAGIVKYKARRDEAQRKLEKTQDNLMRAEDILSELEQQLLPLEEQAEVAKQYLKLREELRLYEINQFLYQYDRHNKRISELKDQITQLERETESRKDKLNTMESVKERLYHSLSVLQQEADMAKKERYDLLNASEKLKGEQNLNQERINHFERDNARLTEEIQRKQQDIKLAEAQLKTLDNTIREKSDELEGAGIKARSLTEKLDKLNLEISEHQKHIEETKSDIIHVLNRISDCRSQLTRYHTIESSLRNRLEKIAELISDRTEEEKSLLQSETSIHNKIMLTQKMLAEKKASKAALEDRITKGKQSLSSMDGQIQKEKQVLEGKGSRLKLLIDMKKGYEGFNKTVKEILTACQSNPSIAHKVCGVVASLIQVPREYETAIETVLGASLQYIVTQDEADAKYLIEFIRKNKFGRATFLPVTSVQARNLSQKERAVLKMDGCLGIASELVECEPEYRSILKNLLGRVVVASDMDAAINMARRFSYTFRIVTLSGDTINTGGSMTGGSHAGSGISILGRNREIKDLQEEITDRKETLEKTEEKRQQVLTAYLKYKADLEAVEKELHALEHQLSSEEESRNRIAIDRTQLRKDISVLESERIQILRDLDELKLSISDTNKELNELESKTTEINQLSQESEGFLRAKTETRESCSRELTDIRIQIAAMQQEIQGFREQAGRIHEDIMRHSNGIKAREQQIQANQNQLEAVRRRIEKEKASIAQLESQAAQLLTKIEETDNMRIQKEQRMNDVEKEIREWNRTTEEIINRKHRLEVQCSRYEAELENYQNNIWEEYGITWNTAVQYKCDRLTPAAVSQKIPDLKLKIAELGDVNVNAIEESKRVRQRYQFLSEQKNDLIMARENLKNVIREITTAMKKRFQEEFAAINRHFGVTFNKLFGGGQAQLILEDPEDVLNCGIDIIAQPPGKKLQSLSLLSGGERALTAIAILFAILKHKPTPFCILDEIDAALDDSNVYQFGRYIKEFSNNTQFAIITHRKGTMEFCDVLYGIAMEEKGVSRLISVKFDEMVS
jgi:chromosome segregation protein